ncbi:hypothetical protein [Rubinisphaera italica]|uniref:Carbohydrate-binding domain-containing protein n=1 Tax=Rubinisphaera italica TaxID=2527969 RepID=A0A5C5XB67_9PLAN|nr:hypothetical protein [Rubinisphaera italica]TWT59889.1 hypothetical protein Pan54_06000 [Rubinisphaera italica]
MNHSSDHLLIPAEFYFQASVEIPWQTDLAKDIQHKKHPEIEKELPDLMFEESDTENSARFFIAWNEDGICLQVKTERKKFPTQSGTLSDPTQGDYTDFFIDTRDLKTNHRASKFCHRFTLIPPGTRGKRKQSAMMIEQEISGNRTYREMTQPEQIPTWDSRSKDGYQVSCWISKAYLEGYDPEHVPSLGFYYRMQDLDYGTRIFGVGENFPATTDPSLWPSLKLVK